MPDKDMRKAALSVGKTTSNKLSSRRSTPAASNRGSRVASRIASRNVSDDEDWHSEFSEETNLSNNSVDALLESNDFKDDEQLSERAYIDTKMDHIVNRNGANNEDRELFLASFIRAMCAHHHGEALAPRTSELIAALKKSIKNEAYPHEVMLALKAVSLIGISTSIDDLYDTMHQTLKNIINDQEHIGSKVVAIHCLAVCASFGGASEMEIESICEFLQEIITSDGGFVGALDDPEVVTAALQAYAYLCTEISDMEDDSEDAIDALLDQLDSSDVNVQIAAGEAIALLFEKSYGPKTATESSSDPDSDEEAEEPALPDRIVIDRNLVRRYHAFHNPGKVQAKIHALANLSAKTISKRDKARLHKAMNCIEITVEDPRAGLQTNNSSKRVVRIQKGSEIKLDKWWKYLRLNTLRRMLGGGFVNHYHEGNSQVLNSLPVLMTSREMRGTMSPRDKTFSKSRNGDRFRGSRKFMTAEA